MFSLVKRLLKEKAGNFAIMTALFAVPIIASAGIALDIMAAFNKQSEIQSAADTAVLTAASSGQTDEEKIKDIVRKAFFTNLTGMYGTKATINSITYTDGKYITMTATATVPLTLAKIIHPQGIPIQIRTQAVSGSDDTVEIAMVLDNTYSMSGQKITDLKAASNTLLDVFDKTLDAKNKDKVRFSLVPFSTYVNVGLPNRNAKWLSVAADSSTSTTTYQCSTNKPVISQTCVKTNKTCYNDGVPYSCTSTSCTNQVYGPPVTTCKDVTNTNTQKWNGCVGSRSNPNDVVDTDATGKKYTGLMNTSCGSPLVQLTNNYTTLRTAIKNMTPNNETYIQPGVIWGLNVLSPEEPFTDAAAYSDDTKKFMIIMTDGSNTRSPNYPTHNSTNTTTADNLMSTTCDNAKKKGITIFTIGVGIGNSTTANKLAACASDPSKAISVEDTSTLKQVFTDIARAILAVRLSI